MSLTDEQLKIRSKGLGGSDIGAMLGLSPWKSPMDLWAEKTGRVIPDDIGEKDFIIFGNLLEDIVAREFARRLDKKCHRRKKTITHKKYDFMLGNIDRKVVGESAVLEVKTASAWCQQQWGEIGTDDVPLYYLTQGVHYMAVLDVDVCYFAVLIGGNEFRWYEVHRDADIEKSLIEKEAEFWRLVLSNSPPDPRSFPDVCTLYPKDSGSGIVATDSIFEKLGQYEKLRQEIEQKKTAQEMVKMAICEFMGNAGRLTDRAGSKLATWISHTRSTPSTILLKERYPEIYDELSEECAVTVRPFRTDQ